MTKRTRRGAYRRPAKQPKPAPKSLSALLAERRQQRLTEEHNEREVERVGAHRDFFDDDDDKRGHHR